MTRIEQGSYDAIVIGAGFSGLYALIKLREMGLTATLLEAAPSIGGTWYWNRYPGARVDVESVDYSYSFSEDLQQEWSWSERYAGQEEILDYLHHVATRFGLTPDIHLGQRVTTLRYVDNEDRWQIVTADATVRHGRYCVMSTGFLSAPLAPVFDGLDSFTGMILKSTEWPDRADFSGQSVGIVGTGSTGVQMLPHIASAAATTYVFQRTPAYTVPLRNKLQLKSFEEDVKRDYTLWRLRQRQAPTGAIAVGSAAAPASAADSALSVSDAERMAIYEQCWENGGIVSFYLSFPDLMADAAANQTLSEFIRNKIRRRVHDPAVAERLIPDYPVMSKRLCADTGYFEAFNLHHVHLVDIADDGLQFDGPGVFVGSDHYDIDILVLATGFDAITGAMKRIHITGRGGQSLASHWEHEVRTAGGLMSSGFPNMFWINGPGSSAADAAPPLMAEDQMAVVGRIIVAADSAGVVADPPMVMEKEWLDECGATMSATLLPKAKSWYNGANVPGKVATGMIYLGGPVRYLELLNQFADRLIDGIEESGTEVRERNQLWAD